MSEMTYSELKSFLSYMIQNLGSQYDENIIKPMIYSISIPAITRRAFWSTMMKEYSLSLVVGTDNYKLPYDFDKFKYLKSKYGELKEETPKDFDAMLPDRTGRQAQDLGMYKIENMMGVYNQISTAENIDVVSSDASDTETVLVRGEVNSLDDYEEITLNGTTAVTSTKTFSSVSYVSKSSVTNGAITVSGNTSSTILTKIPAEHTTAKYKRIVFDSAPQEALTLEGVYKIRIFRPQREDDIIPVPGDLVALHALMLLGWERRSETSQLSLKKQFDDEVALAIKEDLKSYSIESGMVTVNTRRRLIPNDHPLYL